MVRKTMVAAAVAVFGLGGLAVAGGGSAPKPAAVVAEPAGKGGVAVPAGGSAAKAEALDAKLLRMIVADLSSEHREVRAAAEHKLVQAGQAALPFLANVPEEVRPRAESIRQKIFADLLRC